MVAAIERRVSPTAVFFEWIDRGLIEPITRVHMRVHMPFSLQGELAPTRAANETGVHMKLHLACAAVLAAAAILAPGAALADTMVIDNVTLIDGTGQPARAGMSVAIDGDRFVAVTPTAVAGKLKGRRIDGKGRWLIPGLMDVHTHLGGPNPDKTHDQGVQSLASYLYSGVTTVYDAGNDANFILTLRAEERAGKILSPRIFATGKLITYPGSHGSALAIAIEVDSWPQAKSALDKHIAEQKPDIVKLTLEEHGWGSRPMIPLLPLELMENIIHYYNAHGIRTTAHTSSELRATEAIYAGIDSLAHPVIQGPVSDDFVRLMAAKRTPMATTLTIGEGYSRLVEHPEYLDQPLYGASYSKAQIAEMKGKTAAEWKERPWTWWMKLMTPIAQENLRKIDAAGGVIAIGTDQSVGPAVHREMELMQAAGVKPSQVIRMATFNSARHLGLEEELGSIEPGKFADAVLLSADPTVDINNAKEIVAITKSGEIIDEDKLPLAGGPQKRRRDF
jgi:imidazolonepropionase-like amidohydrolase